MTGSVQPDRTLAEIAPRIARAYYAEKAAREPLRHHIVCAGCNFAWWADGKPTTKCPRCASTHLRAGSSIPYSGPLPCKVCGADYGESCREAA
jgi:hypothetical protein